MAEFRFTNEHSPSGVGDVMSVLVQPRQWVPADEYPDYFNRWIPKTEADILNNTKRAMLAMVYRTPAGVIVYRRHETRPRTVEIRNISVVPDFSNRLIGSFMLRQVELEATRYDYPDCDTVIVDTKASNERMLRFLEGHGYELETITDLYGLGAGLDAVLVKRLNQAA